MVSEIGWRSQNEKIIKFQTGNRDVPLAQTDLCYCWGREVCDGNIIHPEVEDQTTADNKRSVSNGCGIFAPPNKFDIEGPHNHDESQVRDVLAQICARIEGFRI